MLAVCCRRAVLRQARAVSCRDSSRALRICRTLTRALNSREARQHESAEPCSTSSPSPLLSPSVALAAAAAAALGPLCDAAHAYSASDSLGWNLHLPPYVVLALVIGLNVVGAQLFLKMVSNMNDESEPVTVTKVQMGLLEKHPALQDKLAQLNGMIQVGQVGSWLILEEAILEVLKHQRHIAYADVQVEEMRSKKRAYGLFGALAESEAARADDEETRAQVHGGQSDAEECTIAPGFMGLLGAQDCSNEATVVTLVVASRGHLDIGRSVESWPQLRHTLQQLTGLTSDKLMGVELLWTPTREEEYLTRSQLLADYPNLKPLRVPVQQQR